jgi:hypothetical protein
MARRQRAQRQIRVVSNTAIRGLSRAADGPLSVTGRRVPVTNGWQTLLWVLTPVAKSDGYWVLADLLSVSSLEGVVRRPIHHDVQRGINSAPARRPQVARRAQTTMGAMVAVSIFLGEQWLIWSMVIHFSQAYTDAVPAVTSLLRQGLGSASGVIVAHEVARLFFPLALIVGFRSLRSGPGSPLCSAGRVPWQPFRKEYGITASAWPVQFQGHSPASGTTVSNVGDLDSGHECGGRGARARIQSTQ